MPDLQNKTFIIWRKQETTPFPIKNFNKSTEVNNVGWTMWKVFSSYTLFQDELRSLYAQNITGETFVATEYVPVDFIMTPYR